MGIVYESPKSSELAAEAKRIAYDLRDRYYPDLKDNEVTISVLLAIEYGQDGPKSDGVPLKDGDLRVTSKSSATNLIARSDEAQRADVQILIDGHWWTDTRPDLQKEALIHEALGYFEIQLNDDKTIKTDSAGRPKIRVKSPDWKISGFAATARLYGEDAVCVQQARDFQKNFGGEVLKQEEASLYSAT